MHIGTPKMFALHLSSEKKHTMLATDSCKFTFSISFEDLWYGIGCTMPFQMTIAIKSLHQ